MRYFCVDETSRHRLHATILIHSRIVWGGFEFTIHVDLVNSSIARFFDVTSPGVITSPYSDMNVSLVGSHQKREIVGRRCQLSATVGCGEASSSREPLYI